jgi:hypothetical protein
MSELADVQTEVSLQPQSSVATNRQGDNDKLQDLTIDDRPSELKNEEEQSVVDADQPEDSEASGSVTSDSYMTSSEETSSDEEVGDDNDASTDEGVFFDVMTKIRELNKRLPKDDSEKSEEDTNNCKGDLQASQEDTEKCDARLKKSILNDAYSILVEVFNLIEKHEDETDTLVTVRKGLKLLAKSIDYTGANELFGNDPGYGLDTFYLYLKLLKLSGIKKYLTHGSTNANANAKLLYEKCIRIFILDIVND